MKTRCVQEFVLTWDFWRCPSVLFSCLPCGVMYISHSLVGVSEVWNSAQNMIYDYTIIMMPGDVLWYLSCSWCGIPFSRFNNAFIWILDGGNENFEFVLTWKVFCLSKPLLVSLPVSVIVMLNPSSRRLILWWLLVVLLMLVGVVTFGGQYKFSQHNQMVLPVSLVFFNSSYLCLYCQNTAISLLFFSLSRISPVYFLVGFYVPNV